MTREELKLRIRDYIGASLESAKDLDNVNALEHIDSPEDITRQVQAILTHNGTVLLCDENGNQVDSRTFYMSKLEYNDYIIEDGILTASFTATISPAWEDSFIFNICICHPWYKKYKLKMMRRKSKKRRSRS